MVTEVVMFLEQRLTQSVSIASQFVTNAMCNYRSFNYLTCRNWEQFGRVFKSNRTVYFV